MKWVPRRGSSHQHCHPHVALNSSTRKLQPVERSPGSSRFSVRSCGHGAQAGAGEWREEDGAAETRRCGLPTAPFPVTLCRLGGKGGRVVGKGGLRLSLGRAGRGEPVFIWFCCCFPAPFLIGNKFHQPCPGQTPLARAQGGSVRRGLGCPFPPGNSHTIGHG